MHNEFKDLIIYYRKIYYYLEIHWYAESIIVAEKKDCKE